MNRYFLQGEERKEMPLRAFARIDDIDPPFPADGRRMMVSLDTVDADWEGFAGNGILSLSPDQSSFGLSQFWKSRFTQTPAKMREMSPYDEVPLYQIEVDLPENPLLRSLLRSFTGWLEITFDKSAGIPVDLFGGLFGEAMRTYLTSVKVVESNLSATLDQAFGMDLWADASEDDLRAILAPRCQIDQLAIFDIGQGSANALLCHCGYAVTYFDLGCGVYRNKKTNPPTIQFCNCDDPVVVLSHWDSDHWAGAAIDKSMLSLEWIAPRQKIGPKHAAFGDAILKAGGVIHVVPTGLPTISVRGPQNLELRRCSGSASDRNGSGLALFVEDHASGRHWLLTGDAGYDKLTRPIPSDIAGLVVPHHGADMGRLSIPPTAPGSDKYARLIYSFGPGNAHGPTSIQHPTQAAVDAHVSAGWIHSGWTASQLGTCAPLHPVLATAEHPSTHKGGARVGWTKPPRRPWHLRRCPKAMPIGQT